MAVEHRLDARAELAELEAGGVAVAREPVLRAIPHDDERHGDADLEERKRGEGDEEVHHRAAPQRLFDEDEAGAALDGAFERERRVGVVEVESARQRQLSADRGRGDVHVVGPEDRGPEADGVEVASLVRCRESAACAQQSQHERERSCRGAPGAAPQRSAHACALRRGVICAHQFEQLHSSVTSSMKTPDPPVASVVAMSRLNSIVTVEPEACAGRNRRPSFQPCVALQGWAGR